MDNKKIKEVLVQLDKVIYMVADLGLNDIVESLYNVFGQIASELDDVEKGE